MKSALAGNYDVILMDIQMSGIDGHEAMASERDKAFQSGFDGYLTKPVNRETLIETVDHWTHQTRV